MEKYSFEKHGVTQGLLATWLQCRQKAKWFMEGYTPKGAASFALTYGTIGHAVLERVYADVMSKEVRSLPNAGDVKRYIALVEKDWRTDNPRADKKALEHLELSLLIAEATLPAYFKFWVKDLKEIKWHSVEQNFATPITLRDGRKTVLRGKRDGVFNNPKTWLFESKFKSQINEADMVDTLPFELQVLTYLWDLWKKFGKVPAGVLYNVVRRTCLKQKESETLPQFAQRCIADIEARPEFYFLRLEVSISEKELMAFEGELLDMLADFSDWWEGISGHYKNTGSCLDKYGRCKFLPLCSSKATHLFVKREHVFPELED